MTKYHKLWVVGFQQLWDLLHIVSEAGNCNIKVLVNSTPEEASLPGFHLLGPHMADSKLSGVSRFKSTFLIMKTHPHDLIYCSFPILNTITLGVRVWHINLWGLGAHSVHNIQRGWPRPLPDHKKKKKIESNPGRVTGKLSRSPFHWYSLLPCGHWLLSVLLSGIWAGSEEGTALPCTEGSPLQVFTNIINFHPPNIPSGSPPPFEDKQRLRFKQVQ